MAYDALKKQKQGQTTMADGVQSNPYAALTQQGSTPAPASGATAPSTPRAAQTLGGSGGPSATGYVNFDSIYNANAGVAQREADKRTGAAEQKAQGVQKGLAGAQQQFQSKLTGGTVAGPNSQDFARASGQLNDFWRPAQRQASPEASQKGGMAEMRNAFAGGPESRMERNTEESWRKNLGVRAGKAYSGPNSLSDVDAYSKLTADAEAAQDMVDNPFTGLSETDRALLGAAGRPEAARLQEQYKDLGGDLVKANTASAADAARARQESAAAHSQYDALTKAYDARKAAEAKATTTGGPIVIGAAPGVGNTSKELGPDAVAGSGAGKTTTEHTDPVAYQQYLNGAQQTYEEVKTPGNEWLQGIAKELGYTPEDMDLIRMAMSPEDWAAYQKAAGMGPENVKAWFDMMIKKAKAK